MTTLIIKMMITGTAVIYSAILYLVVGRGEPVGTLPPKKYVVNLDLPDEEHWTQVATDHKEIVKDIHTMFRQYIPKELIPLIEKIGADIEQYIPAPYAGEMRGIAKAVDAKIGDVVLANLIYDITAFCTSIVSQDSSGQIWHSRNLDYPFTGMLRNITIAVELQKGGKTAYSVVTYAGYVGVLSGQKPQGFTITVDQRNEGNPLLNLLIGLLDKSVVPVSFLVRNALANSADFTEAVNLLAYTPTAAPVYYIIAGAKVSEGTIITKGRLAPDDIWTIDPNNGRWFEVETNYDHWKPPPASDDRRDPAIKGMNAIGRSNISKQTLFNVMSIPPVLNKNTTYTVIMSAAMPELMQTWIRV